MKSKFVITLLLITAAACRAGGSYISIEAESLSNPETALKGPLKVMPLTTRPLPGPNTFIGNYIGVPGIFDKRCEGEATAQYTIDLPKAGDWTVWARANWLVGASDTFSLSVDGSPYRKLVCDGRYGDWTWVRVGQWKLPAGKHTARWKCTGSGTRLDKFLLTDDLDLNLSLVTVRYEDYPRTARAVDAHISLGKHVYRDRETVRAVLYLIAREPRSGLTAEMRVLWHGSSIWVDRKPASVGESLTKIVFNWPLSYEPEDEYRLVATVTDGSGGKLAEAEELVGKLREGSEREWRDQHAAVKTTRRQLGQLIQKAEKKGLDASYPGVSLAVIDAFLPFAEEDFRAGRACRARWTIGYLLESGHRAIAEVRGLIANPFSNRPVPRYHAGRCEIRDGAFWQDGHPIFFTGFGHFYQIIHDIPILSRMGFNIIQPESGAAFILPAEGEVDEDQVQSVRWALDRAAANGMCVNLMLSPHYFPPWARLKWPDIDPPNTRGMRFLIEDERARGVLRDYLKALIPAIKGHPALHSYALSNEPGWINTSPSGLAQFRDWLRRRYSSVSALNELYGTDYADFDAVGFPTDTSSRPARYDWYIYKQDTLLEFHRFLKEMVRELDPRTPVHIKQMGGLFFTEDHSTFGVNHEEFTLLSDISGNDLWNPLNSGAWHPYLREPVEYDQDWRLQANYYDFQRSVSPDHPVQNSENHFIRDFDSSPYPARHLRAGIWNGAVHGQGATTLWLWDRWSWKYYTCDLNAQRPDCMEATGRTALDLMRLGKYFAAFPRERAQVAILQSNASVLDGAATCLPATRNCYEALYFSGARADFVTENQCAGGKLEGRKLLIVPDTRFVADATMQAIGRFAEDGGVVLVVKDGLTLDEYGRPHDLAALVPADGEAADGSGRVIRLKENLTPREYAAALEPLLMELGIPRLARARNLDGTPAWGIGCRAAMVDCRLAVSLVNFRREPAKVTIESDPKVARWKDLVSAKEYTGAIRLDPLAPMLLVPK